MASEHHKSVPMVLLGIVAVTAIVGLVLMFVGTGATGKGIYGGAMEGDKTPYWDGGQGVPDWNGLSYKGNDDPAKIVSLRSSCGAGEIQVTQPNAEYYKSKGCPTTLHPSVDAMWCVDVSKGCLHSQSTW